MHEIAETIWFKEDEEKKSSTKIANKNCIKQPKYGAITEKIVPIYG